MVQQNNISVSDVKTIAIKLIFLKNNVAIDPDPDTINLIVYDSEGNQRGPTYSLTSLPSLKYVPSTKAYYIDIEVTDFPDGQIQAHWFASSGGIGFHDLTHTDRIISSYVFESKQPIVRMGDQVMTQPSPRFFKKYDNPIGPYPIKDETNTPYSPYAVQALIKNPYTQNLVATVTLTEVMSDSLHSGIYDGIWHPDDNLSYGLYQILLQIKDRSTDTEWVNIDAIRTITLMDRPTSAFVEPPLMATAGDVKVICTNIEQYINQKSEAYKEMVILDALKMAHDYLMNSIGAMQYKYQNPILRQAEAIGAAYIIIRSNITLDPILAQRFKDDFDSIVLNLQKTMGYGSEKAAIFG